MSSKAQVARETALQFNPNVKIKPYHDILNASDNRAARNHVNRICLHADVTLIENGTAGYDGQVEIIKKIYTESNLEKFSWLHYTPHLIGARVWAENLFNQRFVPTLDDEDISNDELQFIPQYHNIGPLSECAAVFEDGLKYLSAKVKNFVKSDFRSRFEVKSVVGSIIPVIANTNAVTARIAVLQALKVLLKDFNK
uniref:THIF-type NAD/FAD binding fold domain-containing protein n=1 Tax=Glossina pallidipes TaxID=7398 RepID=A0A1B0A2N3_GLOPL